MRNLSVKVKLIGTIAISLILMIILNVVALLFMNNIDEQYAEAMQTYGYVQGELGEMGIAFHDQRVNILYVLTTTDPEVADQKTANIEKLSAKVDEQLAITEPLFKTAEEKESFAALKQSVETYNKFRDETLDIKESGDSDGAYSHFLANCAPAASVLSSNISSILEAKSVGGQNIAEACKKEVDVIIFAMIAAAMVIVIFAVVMCVIMIKSIIGPLSEVSSAMGAMSKGDLSRQVNYRSKDEFGQMAEVMREMMAEIKSYIDRIARVSEDMANGDLRYAIDGDPFKGDFETIQTSLNSLNAQLNSVLADIREAAVQVSSGSDQVASGAQALAQGATEQASSIQELSATMNEISQQAKTTASKAQEAAKISEISENAVALSNEKMTEMAKAMEVIVEKSNEVQKIVKTIDDIAFQTNILSLNASVEAARAGSAGKGFAVVADEVGNLAKKSQEAARNTALLVDETITAVHRGGAITRETVEALKTVNDSADRINMIIGEINEASARQSDGVSQVTIGIEQISSVVQTNSATAEESAAASEQLSGQAGTMNDLVGRFQLSSNVSNMISAQSSELLQ